MKMGFWRVIVFIGCMGGMLTGASATNVFVVMPGVGTPQSPYTNWATAATNIQTAINAINTNVGNIVYVSNGTYELTAALSVTKAVTIRSWNNGVVDRTNTVIKGQAPTVFRCVSLNHADATLEGFTITNGIADRGGGVYLEVGTVRNCIIAGNTANGAYDDSGGGGGVYIRRIHPSGYLLDSLIYCNKATNSTEQSMGGGVMIYSDGIVSNCVIVSNSADWGGGVTLNHWGGTTGTVVGCEIRDNVGRKGGGVWNKHMGYIRNCIITGNSATNGNGGGVCFDEIGNAGVMQNCLITHNRATDSGSRGGGVATVNNTTSISLENCTICYNQSDGSGGGVRIHNATGDVINVENCIVYYNTATASTYSNLYIGGSSGGGKYYNNCLGTGGYYGATTSGGCNITNAAPVFVSTNANNYRLQAGSPCINTGTNEDWMAGAVDLDGHRRIDYFSRRVDMGAYEYLTSGTMIKVH